MKKPRIVRYIFFSLVLVTCWCLASIPAVTQAAEQTGTQVQSASAWPMYMYDPQRTGRSEYRGPASAIEVKWEARHSGWMDITSLGLAANGDIYTVTESNNLIVLDPRYGHNQGQFSAVMKGAPIVLNNGSIVATDGSKSVIAMQNFDLYAWRFAFKDEDYSDDLQTAPAVSHNGESVFIHAPDGRLFALNATTGKEKWKSDVYADTTPVVGSDGTIYTVSAANRSEPGYLYAVKVDTGAVQWKLQLSSENVGEYNLAVADDGTIYASSRNHLYAVTPSGEMLWEVPIADRLTAPAIGADALYIGSDKGVLYAINFDGSEKWQYKTSEAIQLAPIIGADNTVYLCSAKMLYALDPATGAVLFKYNAQQPITAGPIIDDKGLLYIAANNRVIALHSKAPYAPYQLTAETDRFNNVNLTWQQATGNDEDGFIIEQKIDDLDYKQVGDTTRDITHFELTGLPAGHYTYRVKAYNNAGDSQYSNEVTLDLQATGDSDTKDVRTARFFLNSTTYYQDSSAYMMDVAPIIIEDRTFLPVRYVADALGAEIEWLGAENRVDIVRGENKISLWIDQPQATVNGALHFIDPQNHKVVPTLLPPGRTMLPIRFIAESLDCQVEWDAQTKEVKIVFAK